jgi:hypothetical protein
MPRKSSKGKGGKKGGKAGNIGNEGKDPVTGRTWLIPGNGRSELVRDDVVYEYTYGSPDTVMDDIIKPLNSIPTGAPPTGAAYMQFQLGSDRIVLNGYYQGKMQRSVTLGEFSYDAQKGLAFITPTSSATLFQSDGDPNDLVGNTYNFNPPIKYASNSQELLSTSLAANAQTVAYTYNDGINREEKGGGLAAIRAFGGGKFFFEGWQNNLFDTSLV